MFIWAGRNWMNKETKKLNNNNGQDLLAGIQMRTLQRKN